jgi:hypothetical protein
MSQSLDDSGKLQPLDNCVACIRDLAKLVRETLDAHQRYRKSKLDSQWLEWKQLETELNKQANIVLERDCSFCQGSGVHDWCGRYGWCGCPAADRRRIVEPLAVD